MAIAYASGRLIFATAGDASIAKATGLTEWIVKGWLWYGAANTNTFVLHDEDTKVVAASIAETGRLSQYCAGLHIPVSKLTCTTLGGGTLIVYV